MDFGEGDLDRKSLAVGAVAGHGVVGVGYSKDPGDDVDIFSGEFVGVAAAVVALVVAANSGEAVAELWDLEDDLFAEFGVGFDHVELFVGKSAGLLEDVVGDADFADIVEGAGHVDQVDKAFVVFKGFGEVAGVFGDALGVATGVFVFGVNGLGEGEDCGIAPLLEIKAEVVGVGSDLEAFKFADAVSATGLCLGGGGFGGETHEVGSGGCGVGNADADAGGDFSSFFDSATDLFGDNERIRVIVAKGGELVARVA